MPQTRSCEPCTHSEAPVAQPAHAQGCCHIPFLVSGLIPLLASVPMPHTEPEGFDQRCQRAQSLVGTVPCLYGEQRRSRRALNEEQRKRSCSPLPAAGPQRTALAPPDAGVPSPAPLFALLHPPVQRVLVWRWLMGLCTQWVLPSARIRFIPGVMQGAGGGKGMQEGFGSKQASSTCS